jgi:hypothetical protein
MAQLAGYGHNITSVVVTAGSVTAGTSTYPVLRAPFGGATIKAAYLATTSAVTADGTNFVTATLIDGGAAGTLTTAIGTAGGTTGVTAAPAAYTLNTALDELDSGDYLMARIVKSGTVTEREFAVIIEWVHGKG